MTTYPIAFVPDYYGKPAVAVMEEVEGVYWLLDGDGYTHEQMEKEWQAKFYTAADLAKILAVTPFA